MKTKTKGVWLTSIAFFLLLFNALAQTTTVNGLVVVVNFKDVKIKATMAELEDMFNKPTGFNLWGNETSVREYFRVQTNNKIDFINTLISVDLNQNSTYYVGDGAPGDFTNDVINAVNQKYPAGFSGLSIHPIQGRLYNFSTISQSTKGAGVAWEVWPSRYIKNNGQDVKIFNISHVSWTADYDYDVNTICHEYGHAVWNWTDYYRTAFCNLGMFDVMSSAGSDKSAMPINPAFRMQRGWVDTITNIPGDLTATYSVRANNYGRVYRYVNPANPKEYLIFQAMKHDKFYQATLGTTPVPEGLAIWYVDEETGFGLSGQDSQYAIKLVQADNLDQMHDEDAVGHIGGDLQDLYGNGNNSFPNGHPWRWKDGGEFGITLSNITKSGNFVNFTVNGRTRTVLAMSDINGTLTPRGTVNVTSGTSQSFTLLPDPGYELDAVLVNDVPVAGATSPYTLTGISTTPKTIQPIYKKKTSIPALPSPWQKAYIGTTGLAARDEGKFGLEAEGGRLDGVGTDNLTYVYQTINGNGTIIARVASKNRPNIHHRAGIMIRESLQANAVQTMLVTAAYDGPRVSQRTSTGGGLQNDPNGLKNLHYFNLYNWLKITRTGNEFVTYCSRDGVAWVPLAQQTIVMPSQVLIGLCVAGGVQYFPAKATFDNVSINTTVAPSCSFSGTKIAGTSIGSTGTYGGGDATREKAFDGNIFTYFDGSTDQVWTGLSLANSFKVNGIRFFPRRSFTTRMVGGKFQGSNSADFSTGVVDLATITTEPTYDWNCIAVSNTSSFKYLRYVCPVDGWGNVSEIEFYGTAVAENLPPTVSITSPVSNASYAAPAIITINADASDADGSIWKVEFYNGSTLLGSDFTAPYSYTWNNVPAGVYNITALAIDNVNATASSTRNNIAVINNQAPTVSITSPVTNTSFNAPATINIDVTATDADGSIAKVDFYSGSTLLGTDLTAPYSYTWSNVPAGVYNITALAVDNLGVAASNTRNNIAVIANQPPIVSITSPSSNASFAAPASIAINVAAADADGSIWKVEFYNGSNFLNTDFTAPYSYTWSNVAAGTYSITARAIDNTGAYTEHTITNISVINPTADITGPACVNNNTIVTYELAPSKRVNATGYNWYFTGSTQSFNPSSYQATLTTGNNYGAGQLCVGVSFSAAPYYVTYCINVPKCSGAKMDGSEGEWSEVAGFNTVSYPNPFENEVTLTLPYGNEEASIEVFNSTGNKIQRAQATGAYTFGSELPAGIYFVKIGTSNKTEVIKVIKK